jgi:hypothetical protein
LVNQQVRVLDGVRNVALALIPVRWWQDVVEVPLLITAAFAFIKMLVIRYAGCQDGRSHSSRAR